MMTPGATAGVDGTGSYGRGAAQAQSDRLLTQAQGNSASRDTGRIEKAGKEFESILLGSWLQGAEQSFAAAPGGDAADEDDGSREQFMGLAMQQLAGTLVEAGGIGISRMIVSRLEAAEAPKTGPAAALPGIAAPGLAPGKSRNGTPR